jgi:hypothetical protein
VLRPGGVVEYELPISVDNPLYRLTGDVRNGKMVFLTYNYLQSRLGPQSPGRIVVAELPKS